MRRIAAAVLVLLAAGTARATAQEARLFDPIDEVLRHPRCMNCHMGADFLHQKDGGVRHGRKFAPGRAGHRPAAASCVACHRNENSADGAVPGAPGWRLAPPGMEWRGLSPAQLCAAIKDPARNGNRPALAAVVEHMKAVPLVLWAWQPGAGRAAPAVSHADFVRMLQAWTDAGAPCPRAASEPPAKP